MLSYVDLFIELFFNRPLSEEQLRTIRSIGVFDVVSQVFLSGDGLCSEIFEDSSGMFLDDPSIHGDYCYYGVQNYADRGYCSAVGSGRRFCPCLNSGNTVDLYVFP